MNTSYFERAVFFIVGALLLSVCSGGYPTTSGRVTTEGLSLEWSPDGQWIIFPSSINSGVPELYALSVDQAIAGASRQIWIHLSQGFTEVIEADRLDSLTYMLLEWSPDGRRIAFSAGEALYTFEASCLEVPVTCVDSLTEISSGVSFWLSLEWSPDSKMLLTESSLAGPPISTEKGIMASDLVYVMQIIQADGSGEVVFTRQTEPRRAPDWETQPFGPVWSPDGARIAYFSWDGSNPDISVLSLEDEVAIQFTNTPDEEYGLAWSPDGSQLAYAVLDDEKADIYLLALESGQITCVTCGLLPSWDYALIGPYWSPDGASLAFEINGRKPLFQEAAPMYIYVISTHGEHITTILEEGFPGVPDWSPDGAYLAFGFRPEPPWESLEADIYLAKADGSGLSNLTD